MTTATPSQDTNVKKVSTLRIALGIGLSVLTGVMLLLSFHPYNKWFLAFFAFIPMLVAEHRLFPIKWAGIAPAIGVGGWLFIFLLQMFKGNPAGQVIGIVVVVIIVIQMLTIPGLRRFHERTGYRWFVLQGAVDWVGVEMIRSFIPPINTHAFISQTMYTQPWMLQPISIFSIYGLGVLIMLINFALAQGVLFLFDRKWHFDQTPTPERQNVLRWLAGVGAALVIWIGISLVILSTAPASPTAIRVAAVQHNYPVPGHQDTPESQPQRLLVLADQTRAAAQQGAQLVVWPELGLGFDPQVEYTADLKALAAEVNAYLLIGYGVGDDPRGWRNEMVMLTPDGQFLEVYGKNHNSSPGEPPIVTAGVYPVYDTPLGKLSTLICNDVHYTDTSRILVNNGAQLIAVPTLEIPGIALEQVAQSVMRAVENRVAIVKTDVAYAAAIIDPFGNILALRNGSPDGEAFALVSDVPLGSSHTLYSSVGDWVGWLCLAGFVFFMVLQAVTMRRPKV